MKVYYSPNYVVDLGAHTFPTRKWKLVAEGLRSEAGVELVDPGLPPRQYLELAHTKEWVSKVLGGELTLEDETRLELPWSQALSQAHQAHVMGTLLACRDALKCGVGLHAGGGAHHAFAGHGEGFCLLNDIAVALRVVRKEGRIERAAVVDLDVHQGNGTAAILTEEELGCFSIHQDDVYPFALTPGQRRVGEGAPEPLIQPGRTDIAVPRGMSDDKYLKLLSGQLDSYLNRQRPDLVVYQAGVDVWSGDALGGLKLSPEGVAARDGEVFDACFRRRIPVAVTLGGGYADRLEDAASLHRRTLSLAMEKHDELWPD